MRKHFFNENFFEIIDTEEKAYWLGFIAADGYITSRKNTVGITLDQKDSNHLLKFLKSIESNSTKLHLRTGKYDENSPITNKCSVYLYSNKMSQNLFNLGIKPDKSTSLQKLSMDLSDDLINHFIRGYFDGDGCVFESKVKYGKNKEKISLIAGFTFVGTFDFLTYINQKLPFSVKNLKKDERTQGSYTLYICSKKRFFIVEEFLYKNSNVWLTRKKEKCENIKNKLNSGSETIPQGSTLK